MSPMDATVMNTMLYIMEVVEEGVGMIGGIQGKVGVLGQANVNATHRRCTCTPSGV